MNIAHPVEINLAIIRGREANVIFFDYLTCAVRQRLNFDEPLRRKARLDHGPAAIALADGERVIFLADQKSPFTQIFQHFLTRNLAT